MKSFQASELERTGCRQIREANFWKPTLLFSMSSSSRSPYRTLSGMGGMTTTDPYLVTRQPWSQEKCWKLCCEVVIRYIVVIVILLNLPASDLDVGEARGDPVHHYSLDPSVLGQLLAWADLAGVTGLRIRRGPGTGQRHVVDVYVDYRSFILTDICVKAYWFFS